MKRSARREVDLWWRAIWQVLLDWEQCSDDEGYQFFNEWEIELWKAD